MKVSILDTMKTEKIRKVEVLKRTLFTERANKTVHLFITMPLIHLSQTAQKGERKRSLQLYMIIFSFCIEFKVFFFSKKARVDCSQCNGPFPGNGKKWPLRFILIQQVMYKTVFKKLMHISFEQPYPNTVQLFQQSR